MRARPGGYRRRPPAIGAILVLLVVLLASCSGVPFPPCDEPEAVRCDGTTAQRCEGGHWYPDLDCATTDQICEVRKEGEEEVVRCK